MKTNNDLINDLFEYRNSIVQEAKEKLIKRAATALPVLEEVLTDRLNHIKMDGEISTITDSLIEIIENIKSLKSISILFMVLEKAVNINSIHLIERVIDALETKREEFARKYYWPLNRALEIAIKKNLYKLAVRIARLFKNGGDRRTIHVLKKARFASNTSNSPEYLKILRIREKIVNNIKNIVNEKHEIKNWQAAGMDLTWHED